MKTLFVFALFLGFSQGSSAGDDPILLKNFREIYASYASIMQVDRKSPDLLDLYRLNKDRLPSSGTPSELSSPVVLALTEMSGAFCKKVVDREKEQERGERILFPDVDFELGPIQFQTFLKTKISQHLAGLFWQREASPTELSSLSEHFDKLGAEQPNSVEDTQSLLHILCTTYGTSLAFLVK